MTRWELREQVRTISTLRGIDQAEPHSLDHSVVLGLLLDGVRRELNSEFVRRFLSAERCASPVREQARIQRLYTIAFNDSRLVSLH